MRKVKKIFWEKFLAYPSFKIRFGIIIFLGLVLFLLAIYFIPSYLEVRELSERINIFNLIVQSSTLILGTFAVYYALRQLAETQFNVLDKSGMEELKRKHYSRAFAKWREAFYIRPEAPIFSNFCEALLLMKDYDTFDQYINVPKNKLFKKDIFEEVSDQITLLYLKSIRHLLVRNQGAAEHNLSELIALVQKENGLENFQWDFKDLQTSTPYLDLVGECKIIAENLIFYLSKTMTPERRVDFEDNNFASQV